MFMKTIKERAKREGIISQLRADYPYDKKSVEFGYIQGAYDQKEVDIDKACEWLKINWRKYVYRDRDDGILFGHWESDFRKVMKEKIWKQ